MSTLAQLITNLQALLLGDTTVFDTPTCTAAFRQALKDLNLAIPSHAAEVIQAVTAQYEYELTDQSAMQIIDVLRQGKDTYNDFGVSLPFDGYFEDDRPFIRLRVPEPAANKLIVRYTKPYTISGLDGSAASTLPSIYEAVLLDGAAWKACEIRAVIFE
jgi:hypothetical protein